MCTVGLKRLTCIMGELGVTREWYGIGVELLDGNAVALDEIRANYPQNVAMCCIEMFKKWLEYNLEANWDQLDSALRKVGLISAAENIKSKFTDCLFEFSGNL